MPGGAGLGELLRGVDRAALNGYQLVELIQARYRQLSHDHAELLRDVAELSRVPRKGWFPRGRTHQGGPLDPPARTGDEDLDIADEVAFALSLTSGRAEDLVGLASAVHDLPQVLTALSQGRVDPAKARVLVDETDLCQARGSSPDHRRRSGRRRVHVPPVRCGTGSGSCCTRRTRTRSTSGTRRPSGNVRWSYVRTVTGPPRCTAGTFRRTRPPPRWTSCPGWRRRRSRPGIRTPGSTTVTNAPSARLRADIMVEPPARDRSHHPGQRGRGRRDRARRGQGRHPVDRAVDHRVGPQRAPRRAGRVRAGGRRDRQGRDGRVDEDQRPGVAVRPHPRRAGRARGPAALPAHRRPGRLRAGPGPALPGAELPPPRRTMRHRPHHRLGGPRHHRRRPTLSALSSPSPHQGPRILPLPHRLRPGLDLSRTATPTRSASAASSPPNNDASCNTSSTPANSPTPWPATNASDHRM